MTTVTIKCSKCGTNRTIDRMKWHGATIGETGIVQTIRCYCCKEWKDRSEFNKVVRR